MASEIPNDNATASNRSRDSFKTFKPAVLNDKCSWHTNPTDFERPFCPATRRAANIKCDSNLFQAVGGLVNANREGPPAPTYVTECDFACVVGHVFAHCECDCRNYILVAR